MKSLVPASCSSCEPVFRFPERERAFGIRMQPGDIVLIRGGQFHGLIKSLDENMRLFMFGGYD